MNSDRAELRRLSMAPDRLALAAAAERHARSELDAAARNALDVGLSYADVGRALGISRQAARKRWPGLSNW